MAGGKGRKRKPAAKPVPDLIRRQRAIDTVMRQFAGRNFKLGKSDCLKLFRAHAVAMGHRMPRIPDYSSPGGAMKALGDFIARSASAAHQPSAPSEAEVALEQKKATGGDLAALLDALGLQRIAPAAMLPGDVALVESEPHAPAWRAGSLAISVGRKFLAWHPDSPLLAVIEPTVEQPFLAAWRM